MEFFKNKSRLPLDYTKKIILDLNINKAWEDHYSLETWSGVENIFATFWVITF